MPTLSSQKNRVPGSNGIPAAGSGSAMKTDYGRSLRFRAGASISGIRRLEVLLAPDQFGQENQTLQVKFRKTRDSGQYGELPPAFGLTQEQIDTAKADLTTDSERDFGSRDEQSADLGRLARLFTSRRIVRRVESLSLSRLYSVELFVAHFGKISFLRQRIGFKASYCGSIRPHGSWP